jgi:hypothetical protein
VKHQHYPKDMHYPNEGNVNMNMVGYDTCILSLGYCIVQLDDMKYNPGMRVLHKTKII